jgi:hypothetical protein
VLRDTNTRNKTHQSTTQRSQPQDLGEAAEKVEKIRLKLYPNGPLH